MPPTNSFKTVQSHNHSHNRPARTPQRTISMASTLEAANRLSLSNPNPTQISFPNFDPTQIICPNFDPTQPWMDPTHVHICYKLPRVRCNMGCAMCVGQKLWGKSTNIYWHCCRPGVRRRVVWLTGTNDGMAGNRITCGGGERCYGDARCTHRHEAVSYGDSWCDGGASVQPETTIDEQLRLQLSAQRNETETKLFRNCFVSVQFHFVVRTVLQALAYILL